MYVKINSQTKLQGLSLIVIEVNLLITKQHTHTIAYASVDYVFTNTWIMLSLLSTTYNQAVTLTLLAKE